METVAFPNSLGRVVRMTRDDFVTRAVGRVSGFYGILSDEECERMRNDIRTKAHAKFTELALYERNNQPVYEVEEG